MVERERERLYMLSFVDLVCASLVRDAIVLASGNAGIRLLGEVRSDKMIEWREVQPFLILGLWDWRGRSFY